MNLVETGELLALAALVDARPVDEPTVKWWHSLLADVDLSRAVDALRQHQRTSPHPVKPAHIIAIVNARRTAPKSLAERYPGRNVLQ